MSDRLRLLRYRLGARLLRPYVYRRWQHYNRMADRHHDAGDRDTANNCVYIGIGLQQATRPTLEKVRQEVGDE